MKVKVFLILGLLISISGYLADRFLFQGSKSTYQIPVNFEQCESLVYRLAEITSIVNLNTSVDAEKAIIPEAINSDNQLKEHEKLKKENEQQHHLIAMGIVIILLLIAMIFITLHHSRRKIKKANHSLSEFSNQIEQKAIALQLANESKDKFLSIISHDLKNPISAITGLSELLMDPTLEITEEERGKYLKYINDGCISADHLLENLMKWVRSQTGKLEMSPQEFDLLQPVNEAICLVQNAAIRKNISVTTSLKEGTKVYADHEMISTCIINLLSNAVKFTPHHGSIHIDAELRPELVKLHISDSGIGIPPENIQNLFHPEKKSGTLGTANEKGTGLGLLLVKEFIEKNNGTINVQSSVGAGSVFTLSLPHNNMELIEKMEPTRS
ncbi:MAG: HAMP domain-containing histidine kinase [Bacteroidetes bacterium]|nr:HAMP domain-containing histidine kinase [Bacteroidota bacterium]